MFQEISSFCLNNKVTLVAVSKTQTLEKIKAMYDTGQRIFGENRVQELVTKFETLPKDIEWHLIGHLQKNKVKYIAPFVAMIHSIDSWELLETVHKEAAKNNRIIRTLLQFHIAEEDTKFGISLEDGEKIIQRMNESKLSNVTICGVMGMATFTENVTQVRHEFRQLKSIFDRLKKDYFTDSHNFTEISMGMSGDYKMAIEEGSTMVRIGSALFA